VGTYLPALKNSATQIRYGPVSGVQVQSMSDTLGPKSDESLHMLVNISLRPRVRANQFSAELCTS